MQEIKTVDQSGNIELIRQLFKESDNSLQTKLEEQRQAAYEEAAKLGKKVVSYKIARKIGHNTPCPCGSGLKFKKCCISKVK